MTKSILKDVKNFGERKSDHAYVDYSPLSIGNVYLRHYENHEAALLHVHLSFE